MGKFVQSLEVYENKPLIKIQGRFYEPGAKHGY